MKKLLAILAIVGMLAGCASTQCVKLTQAMDAAEAGYNAAKTSGAPMTEVDKWKWTYDAAKAAVLMWCSTVKTSGAAK